jgi:lambda repressor-like predicted transcriptional regulator
MRTILEDLRTKKGTSLRAMAQETGIHYSRIFRHEKRKEVLYKKDIQRYANFFGIEPERIADDNGFAQLAE